MSKEYILCAAIHYKDGQVYLHQPKNVETGYSDKYLKGVI